MRNEILFSFALFLSASSELYSTCTTPNHETGTCKPVKACTPIKDAIATLNSSAIEFARQSACGFDGEQLVCCGSVGYYREHDRILDRKPSWFESIECTTSRGPKMKTSAASSDKLPDKSVCGIQSEQTRIIGGETTEIGEFPWMVLLKYKAVNGTEAENGTEASFQCGGTLINNRYVLTAAHCLRGMFQKEFLIDGVRLGEWNISSARDCFTDEECADSPVDVDIEEEIVHPYYSVPTGNNDIALLRLSRNIEFTEYIRPICLPEANLELPDAKTMLTVSGWGLTRNGTQSSVKLKVNVPLVSHNECTEKLTSSRARITDNQICAGGQKDKDSCKGDSGGPLMNIQRNSQEGAQWYQEGIVSRGIGCGYGFPGIYTRVSKFTSWIVNNLQP